MSTSHDPFGAPPLRSTLATASLPRRVHRVLEQLFSLVSDEFARDFDRLLAEFEQELFRLAEQARNPALQSGYMETLRSLRLHRADLVPHFLVGLETALTRIRDPGTSIESAATRPSDPRNLRLVEDSEIDEDAALRMIAARHESRASLPLLLLGQRFGVLAGAPAFDAERLPVGPHLLGRILATASRSLQINLEARLLLYRLFDRQLMHNYVPLVEAMNLLLVRENVLPGLSYVPLRVRPNAQPRQPVAAASPPEQQSGRSDRPWAATGAAATGAATTGAAATGAPATGAPATAAAPPVRAYTGWLGEADNAPAGGEDSDMFALLQQLLTERRGLLDKLRARTKDKPRVALPTPDVIAALGALQAQPAAGRPPRSLPDIRQTLLAQSRQQRGQAAALSREDSDTFELLGLLYAEIGRELREDTPSTALLECLQLPLLRLALQDRGFFSRSQHPARQLLNAVAEAGANWLTDEEEDPQLQVQLQSVVEHVVEHYDGDAAVFEAANESLQQHLHRMARKSEISERRHVEAARGKEKLELAKRRAIQAIDAAVRDQRLPKFLRTLLEQAWADVLTLVLLRHGEDSAEWLQHEVATRQIVDTSVHGVAAPAELAGRIEDALALVGYHADEAAAIARRLTSSNDDKADDPADDAASRTELAMKLKARARLGAQGGAKKSATAPRTPREQACYEQLCTLPFGSWIEFATNQQGDMVRRRLAWFSPVTGHALFVNQRGHRVDEQTLDSVARLIAGDQARIVTPDRGRLVDRAWLAAVNALRNIAHRDTRPGDEA